MKISKVISCAVVLCLVAARSAPAGAAAPKPPKIKIALPKRNSSVTTAALAIGGTTSSKTGVTNVYYSLNGSDWTAASTSDNWRIWTANVALTAPGPNTISAYAVDSAGNLSVTSTVSFTYSVVAPLNVQINPPGAGTITVSPKEKNGLYPIGQNVTLTAKAAKGFTFLNWTGSFSTHSAVLAFTMASNLTFTANFASETQPTVVGQWHGTQFKTPAQITFENDGNGGVTINGGDNFDLLSGSLTVNGNGTFSGNFDGAFSGTYSVGGNGIVTLNATSSDGSSTHTLFMNAGKDFMVNLEAEFDTNGGSQALTLFQREPASVAAADITGFWNATSFQTPARIDNAGDGNDSFGTGAGDVSINANGTLTFNLGDSPVSGTYKTGSGGTVTATITENGAKQLHTLFLNASKDIMINAESKTNNGDDQQQLLIFQRAPASVAPSDIAGTWNGAQFRTPAAITFDGNFLSGGDKFNVQLGTLTINTDGTFSGQFDGPFTGTYTIGANGVVTISIPDDGSHTLFINAGKDVMVTSDSENDTNDNRQELIIFQRAPAN